MARKFSRAFTLIELLVVIAIIAILIAIAYPVYSGILERGKVTKDMNNLRQIGMATQAYMNDNDGVLFSVGSSWMLQLQQNQKYLSSWGVFQSPFDKRPPSELGTVATPVSYGINGTPPGIIGTTVDKISKPSVFILFAPAQASGTSVTFQGTAVTGTPGVTVRGIGGNQATSSPGGDATGGTHSSRKMVNALCADLHSENMTWSVFTNNTNSSSDPSAAQRWSP